MRQVIFTLTIFILIASSSCRIFHKTSGTKALKTGQYYKASGLLKNEFDKEERKNTKGELAFYLGESYRKQNLSTKAASAYSKAIRNGYISEEVYIYLGQSLLKTGKITEAEEAFNNALKIESKNKLARLGLKSCEIIKNNKDTSAYKVEPVKILNSKNGDYGVAFDGENYDHIYFTSMRYAGKGKSKSTVTGQGLAHLYETSKNTKGEWDKPTKLDEPINSPFEEGSPFITSDGKEMYYTRCIFDKTKVVEGQIYKCTKSAGVWSIPELLPLYGDSILTAHPTLSEDGKTLYFVSDMPGSIGGKDIWRTEKNDKGDWGKAINMGFPINTPGDEMFPYIRTDGTLYFASNGHPGFGGLDIYKASLDENGEYSIVNLGIPINSQGDDFSIAFMGKKEQGFFATSRDNAKGIDKIYSFILPETEFILNVTVLNQQTQKPIKGCYLKIIGTDGTQLKLPTQANGKFTSRLVKDCDYTILIAAKGYIYSRQKLSTVGYTKSKTFDLNINLLSLNQSFILKGVTFNAGSSECNAIPEEEISKITTLLAANSEMKLEIGAHTDLSKEDNVDQTLSEQRAQRIADQLIKAGIAPQKISIKGYNNTVPLEVTEQMSTNLKFLKKGEFITEKTIQQLRNEKDRAAANQLLRRIEITFLQ